MPPVATKKDSTDVIGTRSVHLFEGIRSPSLIVDKQVIGYPKLAVLTSAGNVNFEPARV